MVPTTSGEPLQLSAMVCSTAARNAKLDRPLLTRLSKDCNHELMLLDTQYRMHPQIAQFPLTRFYSDRVKSADSLDAPQPWYADRRHGPYALLNVSKGLERKGQRGSYQNPVEAAAVCQVLQQLSEQGAKLATDAVVIAFYSAQVALLKTQLHRAGLKAQVHSVDSFQGSEAPIVLLSCVRANKKGNVGFITDARRLNVALTRAQRSCIVLMHVDTFDRGGDTHLKALVQDARGRGVLFEIPDHHHH
eukprot:TRINITY_DN23006_c0_g2_i1.p1 TRINITY_DN23006_c0_g2~~TRINITY_DN23006_c0_g2_i1.p1  ORF type:complete len:247 (+),score=36.25 TRINITY_DN23006_c0_g2_i1:41-781(+)